MLACNVDPDTNMVEALDTMNQVAYDNLPDADQSDITLLSGSYSDGRISCRFVTAAARAMACAGARARGLVLELVG